MADDVLSYTPPATVKDYIRGYKPGELFYDWIVGPVGCLHAKTLVVTEDGLVPIADITQATRVLSWNAKTCQFQLSLCGGAFPKGRDYLYRVVTPQGEFDAAGSHQLLCADGTYRRVSELQVGDALAPYSDDPLQTSAELSRKVCAGDEPYWWQTASDWLGRYAASIRRYGPQPQWQLSTDQGYAPSAVDAPEYKARSCPETGVQLDDPQEQIQEHNHYGRYDDHPRKNYFGSPWGSGVVAGAGSGGAGLYEHAGGWRQAGLQSLQNFWCRLQVQLQLGRRLLSQGCEAFGYTPSSSTVTERPILALIRKKVKEDYWDIQVVDTHNYVTVDGAIHHNSGKTTGLFFKLAYMAKLQAPGPDGIRRTRAVVVRNTAPQLMDTTIVSWNYWFKDGQAGKWQATPKIFTLRFDDVECEVLFRPLDTPDDVARVLSLEVTFAVIDEFVQIPMPIVDALSARLGRYPSMKDGGATNWGMWGSSNPSTEDNAWFDYLHETLPDNARYLVQPSGFSAEAENVENLPGKREYYTNQAKGKSEAWVKQFIESEWGFSVAGKPVVPTFNASMHVSQTPLKYDPSQPIVVGFDPGLGGSAFIFGQDDLHGRLRVYGELVQVGLGAERLISERLMPYLRRRFPGCRVVIAADPAAGNRAQTDEQSVVDVFKKKFDVKIETNNRLPKRLDSIEHYATRLTDVGPALLIDGKECPILVRALKGGWRFVLDPKRDVIRGAEPEKNAYSHPGDAFGYLARYFARLSERAERYGGKIPGSFKPQVHTASTYHFR